MRSVRLLMALAFLFPSVCATQQVAASAASLRFREDGTFRIVQFADVHWSWGFGKDWQSLRLMGAVLDIERPDLVVYTGDNITGRAPLAYRALRQLTAPCAERGIPWAAVFGNHDDEGYAGRQRQMELMRMLPHCLASAGPPDVDGVSNYVLVVGASQAPDSPAALLYFIDSLGYMEYQGERKYNYIQPSQIAWYKNESGRFLERNVGRPLPAIAFFHIPLPEYRLAWESANVVGVKQEEVADSPVNSGLFAAFKEMGDVMAAFVGHDHVNDYIGEVDGIYLGYGRGTGYGTYGKEGFPRGARVIEIIEGRRQIRTWLRLEGGVQEIQIP
ncbi:MAG TPA: metallophosphoesterase family protein [Candidatus Hydrogenedentes bacterium]|nr:metallophosphoesterase family protein [Candidatus Hydrogenedentota bacterium]HNT87795.1 metallophosphoesterase family protein [Candidatus Hydrogenedentota bacterium]